MEKSQLAQIVQLKRARNLELRALVENFFLNVSLLNSVVSNIFNIPGVHKLGIIRFFSIFYNYQANHFHMGAISDIVETPLSMVEKFYNMKEVNTSHILDEFLVTFSRRADEKASVLWNEFLVHAKEKDPLFYKRMEKAAVKGSLRGDMSPSFKVNNLNLLFSVLFISPVGIYYYYISCTDDSKFWVEYAKEGFGGGGLVPGGIGIPDSSGDGINPSPFNPFNSNISNSSNFVPRGLLYDKAGSQTYENRRSELFRKFTLIDNPCSGINIVKLLKEKQSGGGNLLEKGSSSESRKSSFNGSDEKSENAYMSIGGYWDKFIDRFVNIITLGEDQ